MELPLFSSLACYPGTQNLLSQPCDSQPVGVVTRGLWTDEVRWCVYGLRHVLCFFGLLMHGPFSSTTPLQQSGVEASYPPSTVWRATLGLTTSCRKQSGVVTRGLLT